nr:hypothetical protein [uncultured bacterium]
MHKSMAQRGYVVGTDEIALGDEDRVGKPDLALGGLVLVELLVAVAGIHQRDDRIEQIARSDFVIHEEGLRHRARVGDAGGFDDHAVEFDLAGVAARHQVRQGGYQVAADGAADAAVAHLHDLFASVLDENFVVDVFFAEFVFDHGNLHAVRFVQDALEQRGLAATEKAGQDRGRDQFGHGVTPAEKVGGEGSDAQVMQGRRLASVALRATTLQGEFDMFDGKAGRYAGLRHHVGNWRGGAVQAVGAVTAHAFEMSVLPMRLRLGFHMLGQAEPIDAVVTGVLVGQMLLDEPVENPVDRHAVDRFAGHGHLLQDGLVRERVLAGHQAGQHLHSRLRDARPETAQAFPRRIGQADRRGMKRIGLHAAI